MSLAMMLMLAAVSDCHDVEKMRVDVAHFSPAVAVADGHISGFEVELLRRFAERNDCEVEFRLVDFPAIFDGVRSGDAEMAIAGITVTSKRERVVDFSHPLDSGRLAILTRVSGRSFWRCLRDWTRVVFPTVIFVTIFVTAFAHLIWWVERGRNPDFDNSYRAGIGDGFWYVFVLIVSMGFAEKFTKRPIGRVLSVAVMLCWMVVGANLCADLSAWKIVREEIPEMQSSADLSGRKIATISASTSVPEIEKFGGVVIEVDRIEDGVSLLKERKVDAVVFDKIVLKRFAKSGLVLGGELSRQDYAVAFSPGSPMREHFNRFLLRIRESGELEGLLAQYR